MKIVIDIPEDVYIRTVFFYRDFYREFKELDDLVTTMKALENATIIPKNATNGDMLTALFGEKALITLDTHNYLKDWWNTPYHTKQIRRKYNEDSN